MTGATPQVEWLSWLPVVSIVLSIVASGLLLLWICKVRRVIGRKLMARQLWHLAIADLLTAAWHLPWFGLTPLWFYFGVGHDASHSLDTVCHITMYSNIPFMVSVLIEVHISLATALAVLRWHGALRVLSKILPLVWLLGSAFGAVIVWGKDPFWANEYGRCNLHLKHARFFGEEFKALVMVVALMVCIVSYLAGALSSTQVSGAVERRAWRRSHLFVAAAVITWVPFVLFALFSQDLEGDMTFISTNNVVEFYTAFSLLLANGLINAVVYAVTSRFVRQTQRRARLLPDGGGRPASASPSSDSASGASFHVSFESFHQVIHVEPLTADANRTAETEIHALEISHSTLAGQEALHAQDEEAEGDLLACFDEGVTGMGGFQLADFFSFFTLRSAQQLPNY